ncbi:four-carbon acid sugar kinase family protein [Vreelandella malpeensis]|uniref:Four-carbon acid sugar kinase family protein n=1 Tax=Vreelandella malpeensis TaxID=1172368 RepID=A0ABS8DTJ1_9GAMM|nr:four-carbon acid sugar kinase family protein [Halomonas malpeensis]MCB8889644.1 four-carbon acid sugar kinase family protein [Halomonas malpeensis]
MRYVFIADDFTGASDTLATLCRAGLKARLYLSPPSPEEVADLDAFGIATAARSMGQQAIAREMAEIGERLLAHRPEVIHLKVCSTFDSSVSTGNIATAIRALTERLAPKATLIVGGQPSLGRYCVFGHLFARASDGRTYRIDRHPVMQRHPVTPMIESDLRLHFAAMGLDHVVLLDREGLHASTPVPDGPLLCDALESRDLARIGQRFGSGPCPRLWVGASSVVQALYPQHAEVALPSHLPAPLLVFAGSRSAVTAAQVAAAHRLVKIPLSTRQLASGCHAERERITAHLRQGQATLAVLDEDAAHGMSPLELARRCAELIASLVETAPVGTLLVAGGDTSSLALRQLAPKSIDYLGPLADGVPICAANLHDARRLPVIMKGGQMGGVELFDRAFRMTQQ